MKRSEINWQMIYEYDQKCNEIDQSCAKVIGMFVQNKLRIIEKIVTLQKHKVSRAIERFSTIT